jgi:hypothetical protein
MDTRILKLMVGGTRFTPQRVKRSREWRHSIEARKGEPLVDSRLVVCSRALAEKFEPPVGEVWYAISITDPGKPVATLSEKFAGVLRLSFDDVEDTDQGGVIFDRDMAKAAVLSIDNLLEEVDYDSFLIHCEAGISRSNAFAKWFNDQFMGLPQESLEFMNVDPSYAGNCLVTRLLTDTVAELAGESQRRFFGSPINTGSSIYDSSSK